MTAARSQLVDVSLTRYYHCILAKRVCWAATSARIARVCGSWRGSEAFISWITWCLHQPDRGRPLIWGGFLVLCRVSSQPDDRLGGGETSRVRNPQTHCFERRPFCAERFSSVASATNYRDPLSVPPIVCGPIG